MILEQKAKKFDSEKIRVDLLPVEALEDIAAVLTFGANKYGSNNWRNGLAYTRLLGALLRHVFAFMRGQDRDPESGLPHLAHAGCCILFLLWMIQYKPSMDDRFRAVDPESDSRNQVIPIDGQAATIYHEK